jgi:hypothetical protein
MSHSSTCRCTPCLLKPGEPCPKSLCVATAGHAGECVSVWKAPKLLAQLLALAVTKRIGGA